MGELTTHQDVINAARNACAALPSLLAGQTRRMAAVEFVDALNAIMPGHPINMDDGWWRNLSYSEFCAQAAAEALVRRVPPDTIMLLIAVHLSK